MNDTLQLSSIYFLQELRRPNQSKDDAERAGRLRELEQEMLANLMRSRFILAFDASAVSESADQNEMSKELKVLYLKTPNGDILQPIFSDMWEFQKFSAKNSGKYRLAAVPFKALSGSLIKSAKGYVLNPADINMLLPRERLTALSSQQVYEIKFTE